MSNVISFPQRAPLDLPEPGVYARGRHAVVVLEQLPHAVVLVDHLGRLMETDLAPGLDRLDGSAAETFMAVAEMLDTAMKLSMSRGLTPAARKLANELKYQAQRACIQAAEYLQEQRG